MPENCISVKLFLKKNRRGLEDKRGAPWPPQFTEDAAMLNPGVTLRLVKAGPMRKRSLPGWALSTGPGKTALTKDRQFILQWQEKRSVPPRKSRGKSQTQSAPAFSETLMTWWGHCYRRFPCRGVMWWAWRRIRQAAVWGPQQGRPPVSICASVRRHK